MTRASLARRTLTAITATAAAGGLAITLAPPAGAHGYITGGDVIARAAMPGNTGLGQIAYEPQSLEAEKGFPSAGPADGQIASAGRVRGGELDAQTATRWKKNQVTSGPITVSWTYSAPHATSEWRYYLTKPGWDPNDPLERSDLELVDTVDHDGSPASSNPTHEVTIPGDRDGYHVLLAVWDVSDTGNAFYNVVDLDVDGKGSQPTDPEPTTPEPTTPEPTTPEPTTPEPTTPEPTTPEPTDGIAEWDSKGSYRTGDLVRHDGKVYECRQSHRGFGDTSWITAAALWRPVDAS